MSVGLKWAVSVMFFGISLFACTSKDTTAKQSDGQDTKFTQYYIKGENLYRKHCSNCHQSNGKGLGLLYPPLDSSDYIDNHFHEVMCLIRYGISGELIVNGKNFNKAMPAIPTLTDLEIAELTTYLYNTWGRKKGIADVKEATAILERCRADRR
jgi:mono/diheme cytochrome c family protein